MTGSCLCQHGRNYFRATGAAERGGQSSAQCFHTAASVPASTQPPAWLRAGQPHTPAQVQPNRQHWDRTGRDGTGSARILEHEMVTVLLHSHPQAKGQMLHGNLHLHIPEYFLS